VSDRQETAVGRHSPQKTGVETRTDQQGRDRHRGVVYDKRAKRPIRGPWTSSLAAARAWRNDALDRLAKGTLSGDRGPTVRQATKTFLAGIEDGSIHNRSRRRYKPSVVRDYRRDLGKRIDPLLGPCYLREVQLPDVQLAADTLSGQDLSASSVRNTIMALRALYGWARPRGLAVQQPCDGVRLPGGEEQRMRIVSPDMAALLVGALVGRDRTAFALACYAGLRAGEALALDWSNIDLDIRVIRVERGWDHGSHDFIAPKSKAARRVVPIIERLNAVLVDHRDQFGDEGLTLPALSGDPAKPMGHSALVKRLKTAWEGAELEPLKLHEARHTFASMLIAAGANPKAITTYMGHSSIQVTFDRYGHLMPGSEAQIAGLLDAYLETGAG
jgi:integrase